MQINVTKTFLPPQEEYQKVLQRAWDKGWMTNRGELVKELELKLEYYLQSPPLIAMTNGTLPLQIAIKALDLKGEIITTPFSYVATTSSIVWEGCTPIFVDIHPEYLTIDETKIEQAITQNTSAILATHVFGNPCNIEAIDLIAKKHQLKVIYDAAHCFGVNYKEKSIFHYGDISTCSFHATKIFHTGEGGALFTSDNELYKKCFDSHNFGHDGPGKFSFLGINGKMSELQAAMGLAVLPYFEKIKRNRETVINRYKQAFKTFGVDRFKLRDNTTWNYSYYPIILQSESILLEIVKELDSKLINSRRYFYPSLDNLPYVDRFNVEISNSISKRVLCLPVFDDLSMFNQERIIEIILHYVSRK